MRPKPLRTAEPGRAEPGRAAPDRADVGRRTRESDRFGNVQIEPEKSRPFSARGTSLLSVAPGRRQVQLSQPQIMCTYKASEAAFLERLFIKSICIYVTELAALLNLSRLVS